MPWTGAAAAGLMGGSSVAGQMYTMSASKKAAKKLIRWQDLLSRTAVQRRVEDLRKAGINPILAAHGQGAAVSSGAMPQIPDFGQSIAGGISSAIQAKQVKANVNVANAQADVAKVTASMDKAMLKHFNSLPKDIQALIMSGKLATHAGAPGVYGAIIEVLKNIGKQPNSGLTKKRMPTADEIDKIIKQYVPDGMVP